MSRTKKAFKNIKFSLIGQILTLMANFVTRIFFVRILNAEYLGINGLFTNILSILSLAELGIGASIVYSMYKPLAKNNIEKLKGLMKFYKKAYFTIGFFILIFGIILTPFLGFFIKEVPEIANLKLIYIMYVFNTGTSYFFSYKRAFLIADQKKYIDSLYRYSFYLLRNILQIAVLIITKDFIFYLSIKIITMLAENITISKKVDNLYPFLKDKNNAYLEEEEKKEIFKNVRAMIFHKLGNVIVMGTDNLLISKFVGIVEVGLYSNYLLVIRALSQIFGVVFQSITASIGNLGVTESKKKKEFIFRCTDLLGLWIYGFASIALLNLFNPFINLWLGSEYLFSYDIIILIVISFYLTGRRKSVLSFRDALGLFWYDRYKPIFESVINLVLSIILGKMLGIEGIILGTILSTLTTSFWIEPYILYKYGFNSNMKIHLVRYLILSLIVLIISVITFWVNSLLPSGYVLSFIYKVLITALLPNSLFALVFWKTNEFKYLFESIKPIFMDVLN